MIEISGSLFPVSNIFHLQVGFLGGICMPCYELLHKVLPNIATMKEQCADNLSTWKQLANERKAEKKEAEKKET